jgi:HEAT repeat protein
MGLFDKFKAMGKGRDEKRVASALAKIKNPKAIREDRVAAIDAMAHLGDAATAVPILLQRFEYSLEHGINDTREKESCMDAVVGYGPEALPHVKDHLLKTTRIAWPIKILKALGEEKQVIEILKEALDFGDVSFDQAKVDKNYDILCYMVEYKLPGFTDKLAHFTNDPDERVRFAATEALIEQDDPRVPELLERFIGDDSSENTRLRKSVIEAFFKHRWQLKNPGRFENGQVVGPIFVGMDMRLELRK